MKRSRILILVFISFLIRLAVVPLYHHSDADTIFYWGKYLWETKDFLGFLGKGVPNAMPAVYPPLFYYLLFLWRGFYYLIEQFLWFLNINLKIFPSSVIFWFQSYEINIAFNKSLAIVSDLGCGYLIYKIIYLLTKNLKSSFFSAGFFLLFPASWYLSSYWGQVDSIFCAFVLLSVFLLLKEKYLLSFFVLGNSLLVKQTALIVLPVFLIFFLKKRKYAEIAVSSLFIFFESIILFFPFFPIKTLNSMTEFYLKSLSGEINYLVANGFNFWGLLYGFLPKSPNFPTLGISSSILGYFISLILILIIAVKFWRQSNIVLFLESLFLTIFGFFLFGPNMHERYFFPAYIFLCILIGMEKKWKKYGIVLSIIFILNLYNQWFYPAIPFLISMLNNQIFIKILITFNIVIYFLLLNDFLRVQSDKIDNIHK